ncbi:GNAT family N-acetyltransferase [Streptomyces sp. NL15-2K]|uniref:GNAT family N-acetyltransferase n=1 Tax=Streptomyces sp. NL15-2K TaxID=376149 RepID=UPI000FF920C5|nr:MULTISPECIES: GNAT family N-acetyltransferase [Actinomycetes]WKX07873.1 GNAT family N-acetyltransferase [Kutzneria buriramensis]GCB50686.1 acetyltransferase [Streptomyces sp. NL15-2K]
MIAQPHIRPRSATVADIEELVRLRGHLLSSGTGVYVARDPEEDAAWRRAYRAWLGRVLAGPADRVHVTVVGTPETLAACAIAVVDERAPTARCPNGLTGWVQTVVVDPPWRRRGLGARVMDHALGWLRAREVSAVVLQTTEDGAPLYQKLGFAPTGEDLLTLDLRGDSIP